MTEHDTLKVDQHKIENDISNLEFITTQREDPHPLRWGMNRRHIPKQP